MLLGYKVDKFLDTKRPFAFQLQSEGLRSWFLSAASEDEMVNWIEAIECVVQGVKQDKKLIQIEEKLRGNAYKIPPEELEWTDQNLGKGAQGIVKKAIWQGTTDVAVKLLNNLPEFVDEKELGSFYKEIELLR